MTLTYFDVVGLSSKLITKVYSIKLGTTFNKAEIWPMALGAGIGVLVIVIILLILWKTGILAKMRPYANKMEEDGQQQRTDKRGMISLSQINVENLPTGGADNLTYQ